MKRIFTLMAMLFLIVTLFSCEDNELNEDFLWYRKAETKCADPWDTYTGQSDSDLKKAIKKYLNENEIEYGKVEIGFNSTLVQLCKSCGCTTGTYIELHAANIHEEALTAIGFMLFSDE